MLEWRICDQKRKTNKINIKANLSYKIITYIKKKIHTDFFNISGLLYASLLSNPRLRINKLGHGQSFQHTFCLPCSMHSPFPHG